MKRILFLAVTLLTLGWNGAKAQMNVPELPFDPQVTKGTLPNGLTYYIQHNENPKKRAFFYIAQKVGSVQEEEDQRGLAHFLEHMCFNGSEHFKGNGVVSFLQKIGVQFGNHLNAYTAFDRTVYNIDNVPTDDAKNLDSCLYVLYDWSHALTLDPKEIDKERGVIHEEWRVRNTGGYRVMARQLPKLFNGSKYGERMPIGLMEVVDKFKPKALRDYYEKWYRPDLQGIVVIGDIDVQQMEQKIKDIFGKLPAPKADAAKFEYYPVPDNKEPIFVFDKDKEITAPNVSVMIKMDPLPRQMRNTALAISVEYMKNIISMILNYRLSDLLQQADAPVVSCNAGIDNFIGACTKENFEVGFRPKDGQDDAALAMAFRELIRVHKYGFTASEYKRAQADLEAILDKGVEERKTVKTSKLVDECVENFLENATKTSFETEVALYRQMIKNIPLQGINQVAMQMVSLDSNLVVYGVYPEKEGVKVPTEADAAKVLAQVQQENIEPMKEEVINTQLIEKEPKAGTIKKELPADALGYKGFVLSNGVTVKYKATDFDEGKIIMNAVSLGGKFKLERKDLNNAAMFNTVMRGNGVGKFNGNELDKALTGRVAGISPSLGNATESLSGSSSKKDFRTLLQLTYLYFTEINYDTINYRKAYKQQEAVLANRDANPMTALQDSLQMNLYNHSMYVAPFTTVRLKKVNYDGILKIYKERFANPADFTFIFTGALNEDSLKTFAKQYLASLPTTNKLEKATNPGMHFMKGQKTCRFSKKMETPQTFVVNVLNGNCPLTMENQVLSEATGQVLDIHFTETIREKYSFAYSTQAVGMTDNFNGSDKGYITQIIAPVKPEKCDSTILLINQGIEEIAEKGVNDEVLTKVKEQMLKEYETNQRENRYWLAGEVELTTFAHDQITGEKEAIEGLTSDKIKAFVKDYLLKQNNLFVVIEPTKK